MQIFILPLSVSSPKAGNVVVTLLGVKDLIARGYGPGVIDKQTLTPRAAEYWEAAKASLFPNDSNKSYPLD